jgi:hypothetical protein
LTFFAVDGSGRHVPANNQPSSFPSTQPRPPEAAPRGYRCVPTNSCANKNTGLPGSSAAEKHIFGGRQITGKPCIQAIFQALICFLHLSSIPRTQRDWSGETCLQAVLLVFYTPVPVKYLNPGLELPDRRKHKPCALDS